MSTSSSISSRRSPTGISSSHTSFEHSYYIIEGVEEVDEYQKGGYHPVSLLDTFCNKRYQVVNKLGYGGYSTIWLARDHKLAKYVALKILMADVEQENELCVAQQLSSALKDDEIGKKLLSTLLDSFEIVGPNGTHKCLVLEPGRMSLSLAKDDTPGDEGTFKFEAHRAVIGQVILAVAKLHENGIVHGDLHSGNVLFHLPEDINQLSIEQLYQRFGQPRTEALCRLDKEAIPPSAPKEVVYPMWLGVGPTELRVEESAIFLCDFGESYNPLEVKRDYSNTPKLNRPPEVRFSEDGLSFPSDIWTLGSLLFKIMSPGPLWLTFFEDDDEITAQHVAACGKLPGDWWEKWDARVQYCDDDGNRIDDKKLITFEQRFDWSCQRPRTRMKAEYVSDEEKKDFLDALRKMLVLHPNQRATIHEIMKTEWFVKWILPAVQKVEHSVNDSTTEFTKESSPAMEEKEIGGNVIVLSSGLSDDQGRTIPRWWVRLWLALIQKCKGFF